VKEALASGGLSYTRRNGGGRVRVVLAGNGATQRVSGTGPEGRHADRAGANEKGRMSDQGGACGFALCNAISASLFANGAVTAALSAAFREGTASDVERQQGAGANGELGDADVDRLAKAVRSSYGGARRVALKALTAYCASQSCSAGSGSVDFGQVTFKWKKELFFPGETKDSESFTGAYVDRSTSPTTIWLYSGGIALQGRGTDYRALAEVLLHEFRHQTPGGTVLWQQYLQGGQTLPHNQRPHEIDAFNFAKQVMQHATR
jgi:hypothetical protein